MVGEDTVTLKSEQKRLIPVLCALAAAAVLVSCSGMVDDPETVEKKLVAAYGGPDRIRLLQNYTGKGFMKDFSSTVAAKSHPLDIYQRGELFKTTITRLSKGKPVELMMTIYDGSELYQWIYSQGRKEIPLWELNIKKYKFPNVLVWIQQTDVRGTLSTDTAEMGIYRLHYENEDDIVDLMVDGKSWLLKETRITSKADSAFMYSEVYGDYREIDGVPFPNRYTGTYKNNPYYEYMIPVIKYGTELPDSIFSVTSADTTFISRVLSATKAEGTK